jgi:hypothetical protein
MSMNQMQDLRDELDELQRAFDHLWEEHQHCGYSMDSPEVTIEVNTLEPRWEFAPGLDTALISTASRSEATVTIVQNGTRWTLTTDRWTVEKLS